MPQLEFRNVSSAYGQARILQGVDLSVDRGEVLSLIGPSGSGKSTLLRVLIGLTPLLEGEILVDGHPVDYSSRQTARSLRDRMSIVFQQYNLFQNMTVMQNVTIAPIKVKKMTRPDAIARAGFLLEKVGMSDKHHAFPDQLSGGQQQRVAIARALATDPEFLLLDEVTSALDPERVNEVLDTIRGLTHEGITMIIVSHEMGFVREVSTRIAMMDQGRVVEIAAPKTLFGSPREARTREFVSNVLTH